MKYRCVSYPHLEPDHTWLRQILLFVDEIHRIVPADETIVDSDDLKRLMAVCPNAVRRCRPDPYVEVSDSQSRLFGRALEQPRFREIAKAKEIIMKVGLTGSLEVADWEFLHVDKIGWNVRDQLQQRNMLRDLSDGVWLSVPRGVGDIVLSIIADNVAEARGFDAVTDQAIPFAMCGLSQCLPEAHPQLEGLIASVVASIHVPANISLLSPNNYAELRSRHEEARSEYARMVHELKEQALLDKITDPEELRSRVEEISAEVRKQLQQFRKTKIASQINEWVPLVLTTVVPVAATVILGPLPGAITGLFSFGINAVAKAIKPPSQVRYPRVLQTLCAADAAAADAALAHFHLGLPATL